MFCRACGGQVEADDAFCPNCGKPRAAAAPAQAGAQAAAPVQRAAPVAVAAVPAAPAAAVASRAGGFGLEAILGIAMIASFILPWVGAMGISISGFDLAKGGSSGSLVWLVPIAGIAVVFASMKGKSLRMIGPLCGAVPFLCLAVWISQAGGTQLLQSLSFGAYLAVAAGAVLLIMGPMKAKKAAARG